MSKAYLFYKIDKKNASKKFLCDFHVNLEKEDNLDIANQIDDYLFPYLLENKVLKDCYYCIMIEIEGKRNGYYPIPSEMEIIEVYDFMNNLYKTSFITELKV